MKLNLDCEISVMPIALNVAFKVMAERPDQETGTKGIVRAQTNGITFECIRNADSYTVREVTDGTA